MSLLLASAVRMLFPPVTDQLQGASAPASWLKRAGEEGGISQGVVLAFKGVAAMVAAAMVGSWMRDSSAMSNARVVMLLLVVLVALQLWRRG